MAHQLLLLNREVQVQDTLQELVYLFQETGSGTTCERMFSLVRPVFVRSEKGRWVMMRSTESLSELQFLFQSL